MGTSGEGGLFVRLPDLLRYRRQDAKTPRRQGREGAPSAPETGPSRGAARTPPLPGFPWRVCVLGLGVPSPPPGGSRRRRPRPREAGPRRECRLVRQELREAVEERRV